jgi:hypothetical protein
MSDAIDLTGAYETLTHLAVGQSLHAPGGVHILLHEEAERLLGDGAVKRARSKRGAYDLPTRAEYVSAGYPAHYYPLFVKNETDEVPFDAADAFAEGKAVAPAPPEWHEIARAEGRSGVIGEPVSPPPASEGEGAAAAPEPAKDEVAQAGAIFGRDATAPIVDSAVAESAETVAPGKSSRRRGGGESNPNRAGSR